MSIDIENFFFLALIDLSKPAVREISLKFSAKLFTENRWQ